MLPRSTMAQVRSTMSVSSLITWKAWCRSSERSGLRGMALIVMNRMPPSTSQRTNAGRHWCPHAPDFLPAAEPSALVLVGALVLAMVRIVPIPDCALPRL